MNRKYFFLLAAMLICGFMSAQENHYVYNYHDFAHKITVVAQINIDGVEQTSSDYEIGAFDGTNVTGSARIGEYGSNHYYRAYFAIFYNTAYDATFKLYNHATGAELTDCTITNHLGEPLTFVWEDENGYGTNKKPVIFNFVTTPAPTFTKEIVGYGNNDGGYYLIASPVEENITPSADNGFITSAYDLYMFDQTGDQEGKEWINYKPNNGSFDLVNGMGYLYASSTNTTLTFSGTPVEEDTYEVSLVKDNDAYFAGWNLVGNPFAEQTAYIDRDCFVMNTDGRAEIIASDTRSIEAMEGAFVIATENDETLVFSTEAPAKSSMVTLNLSNGRSVIDRAIVRFGEGRQLPKFQLRNNSSKVYFPIDGQDFAVVHSEGIGEMPVSFNAEENGTYTISFNTEEVNFSYLHLIDNMTGNDIDLLANSSYSFKAKVTDYASRFKLVFICGDANVDNDFAYFNNGSLVISNEGHATLQMVDVMGRIVKTEIINGSTNININAVPGIYMLRLVNGESVKTQKMVVK